MAIPLNERRARAGIGSRVWVALVAALPLGAAAPGWAQPVAAPPGAESVPANEPSKTAEAELRAAARAAFSKGQAAYRAGDYSAAEAHFLRANELLPAVQAAYWRVVSQDKQGKVSQAAAGYRALLGSADAASLRASELEYARERSAELKQVPAALELSVSPPAARVNVNGGWIGDARPLHLKLGSGRHRVMVTAPGFASHTFEISVEPGESLVRRVELEPLTAPVAATNPTPPSPSSRADDSRPPTSRLPAYITLGLAGASAAAGAVFGLRALEDKRQFDSSPAISSADDTERNALLADMAFGVAATLGVTAVVLLTQQEPIGTAEGLHLAPIVTASGAGAAAWMDF